MKIATILALFSAAVLAPAADTLTLASPNGQIRFHLVVAGGDLEYSVTLKSKPVIDRSSLGIAVDGVNLAAGVRLGKAARYRTDETYAWYGVHSTAVDRSNGVKIPVTHTR